MKHSLLLLTLLFTSLFSANTYSQVWTPLYAGFHQFSGIPNQLRVYDTTASALNLIDTKTLTTDIATPVQGTYGLSLHPQSQEMYILYQDPGGITMRRLGILDTVTAIITDIGVVGNMSDICFVGNTLYTSSCSMDGFQFYEVDITDASTTSIYTHTPNGPAISMCYDYFNDRILRLCNYNNTTEIDPGTLVETNLGATGHPGWTNGMAMKNDSVAYVISGQDFVEYNLNTWAVTFIATFGDFTHAMSFNRYPLLTVVNGPSTFCENDSSLLSVNESGAAYQWYLDGVAITGATDSVWYPVSSGTYYCDVDGTNSIPAQIIVLPAPVASFTAAPNPLDLGFTPSGTVSFTNTSTGGHSYFWDFGTGIFAGIENPNYSYTGVGSYTVEFIVTDTVNGCMDTAWTTIDVINSTGLLELSADFNIYPIPANDIVNVALTNGLGEYHVELIGLEGKQIGTYVISEGETNVQIELSDLPSGTYLIKIYNEVEEGVFRIVKE